MIHLYWCGYMILLVWQDKHDIEQTTIINVEITTLWSKEVPLTLHRSDCWKWKPLPAKEPCAYSAWHSMSLFLIGALSYPLRALATGKGLSMSSRFTPFDCAWAFCLQMPPWAPRGWVRRYFSPQPSDAQQLHSPQYGRASFRSLSIYYSHHLKISQVSQVMALWQLDAWLITVITSLPLMLRCLKWLCFVAGKAVCQQDSLLKPQLSRAAVAVPAGFHSRWVVVHQDWCAYAGFQGTGTVESETVSQNPRMTIY